ncbi:MAG: FUSC family protein, partial [Frankia sp.]
DPAALRTQAAAQRINAPHEAERVSDLLDQVADELDAYQLNSRVFAGDVSAAAAQHPAFTAVVALEGAKPAGARSLAGRAAAGAQRTWWRDGPRLAPTTVTAIQALIAVAIAIPIGDAFDARRYYWAVIGVMIMMMGVSTPHERGRKVLSRIAGTVLGAALGLTAHHLIGHTHPLWALTVIILSLSICAYAFSISYSTFVTFLVTALVQLYAITSGGDLNRLMVHRLAENALGAGTAVIITLIVLPIATQTVVRFGVHASLTALRGFVTSLGQHLTDPGGDRRLRSDSRKLDHALFQTQQVSNHLVRPPDRLARLSALPGAATDRHQHLDGVLEDLAATARHARTIARHAPPPHARPAAVSTATTGIIDTLTTSLAALDSRIDGPGHYEWTSCGPLIDQLLAELTENDGDLTPTLTALRELDRSLGVIAAGLDLTATDDPHGTPPGRHPFASPIPTT